MVPAIIAAVVVLVGALWTYSQIKRMSSLKSSVRDSWAKVVACLDRRYELALELAKLGKEAHPTDGRVFEHIVPVRERAKQAGGLAFEENELVYSINAALAMAESSATLSASSRFREVKRELKTIEDRLGPARKNYNTAAKMLNVAVDRVPSSFFSGGERPHPIFEIESVVFRDLMKTRV